MYVRTWASKHNGKKLTKKVSFRNSDTSPKSCKRQAKMNDHIFASFFKHCDHKVNSYRLLSLLEQEEWIPKISWSYCFCPQICLIESCGKSGSYFVFWPLSLVKFVSYIKMYWKKRKHPQESNVFLWIQLKMDRTFFSILAPFVFSLVDTIRSGLNIDVIEMENGIAYPKSPIAMLSNQYNHRVSTLQLSGTIGYGIVRMVLPNVSVLVILVESCPLNSFVLMVDGW